jgi:hypothetical protein
MDAFLFGSCFSTAGPGHSVKCDRRNPSSFARREGNPHVDCTSPVAGEGPHNIAWTHPDEVNTALLEFLAA